VGREEDTTKQKEIDETHLAFIDLNSSLFGLLSHVWLLGTKKNWEENKSTSSYNEP
jgi:hypothetical protein